MGFKKRPATTTTKRKATADSPAAGGAKRRRSAKAADDELGEDLGTGGEEDEDAGEQDRDGRARARSTADGDNDEVEEEVADEDAAITDDDFPDSSDFDDGFADDSPARYADIDDSDYVASPADGFRALGEDFDGAEEEEEEDEVVKEEEEEEVVEEEEEEEEEEAPVQGRGDSFSAFDEDFRDEDEDDFSADLLKSRNFKKPKKPITPTNVDQYISTLGQPQRLLMARMRTLVRDTVPQAEETLKLGMPHYALDGQPVMYLDAKRDHVNLGFNKGAHITHAHASAPRLLQGTGPNLRYIKVFGAEDIKPDVFRQLMEAAVMYHERLLSGVG